MNYIYFCSNCNNEQEVWHSMIEEPEIKCNKCNSIMKRKITGGAGFQLKGYGWTTQGSKDGTQSKGIKTTETKVAVPLSMNGVVSEEVKKSANKVEIVK